LIESGKQESRKGISEIEGKVARVATSEIGSERVSRQEKLRNQAFSTS
jgi:hypothetical protein